MFAIFLTRDGTTPSEPPAFKVDDDSFLAYTGRPGIFAAPYLARHRWIQIKSDKAMPDQELLALLTRSDELVRARLSKRLQKELGG